MRNILRIMALVIVAAVFAGCASTEYQGGGSGELHPGHVGHEKH